MRLGFIYISRGKVSLRQEMGQGRERPCPKVSISLKGNLSQVPRDHTTGQVTNESIIPQIYGNANGCAPWAPYLLPNSEPFHVPVSTKARLSEQTLELWNEKCARTYIMLNPEETLTDTLLEIWERCLWASSSSFLFGSY